MDELKLLGRERAEFQRAESFQSRANLTEYVIATFGVVVLLLSNVTATYILAVVDLLLVILWQFFVYQYRTSHCVAERARRALLLSNGLGIQLSGKAFTDLMMKFKSDEASGKLHEDDKYYACEVDEPGVERLAGILEESVFWTKHLFDESATRRWCVSAIVLLLAIAGLLLIPTIASQSTEILVASVFCVLLTWLVTSSILTSAIAFHEAASAVDDIEGRLEAALRGQDLKTEIWAILGDYDATLQGAPTMPSNVYEKNKARLNNLWLERRDQA